MLTGCTTDRIWESEETSLRGLALLSKAPGVGLLLQNPLSKTGLRARQAANSHASSFALKQCLKSIPIAQNVMEGQGLTALPLTCQEYRGHPQGWSGLI